MKFIKRSLTPAIATRGVMHYWNGDYGKSYKLLHRAHRWGPKIVRGSIFEGFLGLSLYRLGNRQDFTEYLVSAREGITSNPSEDAETKSVESALLREIEQVLADASSL